MNKKQTKPILLPIAPKDVFRILALRCVVDFKTMPNALFANWDSIYHRITMTERLNKGKHFGYEHKGLSADKDSSLKGKSFDRFTERQLCASPHAFFGKKKDEVIGQVIDYELPLDCSRGSAYGKIDLVSADWKNNKLFLLEVKKVDSDEHPLRAMFEIFTFWKMLMDENGRFDTFLKAYEGSKQFSGQNLSFGDKMDVVPGLLLCATSKVFKQLNSTKESLDENELYKRFLSKPIELRIFSYSADDLSVTDVTDTIKRNCGMDKSGSI